LSSFDDVCLVPVYVFLGNPKVLVEMMNTMHALQMFDNGEYMVITVDMETYSYREAYKYLWRKYPYHLNIQNTLPDTCSLSLSLSLHTHSKNIT
jgi:hypothetical protein